MSTTTFTNGQTPIVADWLNDINNAVYTQTTRVATEGQTVFTGLTNCLHGHTQVYVNGLYQEKDFAYAVTSDTTITFSEGLSLDDRVIFKGL